ncbi:MAG: ABC transporter ATP-binding protein [Bacteroidales bacterium]|nr:ABC transporter ATP-binding protein [Bacteroidales bacterium]
MIHLENIQFGYSKSRRLFDDVTLTMEPGHIYGLLGKNGAGKTTLLKIMTGLLFPNAGKATILSENASLRKAEALQNLYFLQEEMYVPHLKIAQFEAAYAPFYPNFSHEQFEYYLTEFEIAGSPNYLDKLSHGQKKKVLIAFALATNTQILIMDEPTNGLDIPSKSVFRRVMASSIDDRRLVIISTHQVRDLHSLIDMVSILDNGCMLLNASTYEITQKLLFDVDDTKSAEGKVFYTEETPRGNYQVKENVNNLDSNLDLELLFNAAIINKNEITNLFK